VDAPSTLASPATSVAGLHPSLRFETIRLQTKINNSASNKIINFYS